MTPEQNNENIDYIGITDTEKIDETTKGGRAYLKNEKHKSKNRKKKLILKILLILLIVIALVMATAYGLFLAGKHQMTSLKDVEIKPPVSSEVASEEDGKTVTYKGKTYTLNENMTSILCMGIDRTELSSSNSYGANGQADSIFVMAIDTVTGKVTIIPINRDTLVDSNIYTESGEFAGAEKQPICLVYANSDGGKKSCDNMMKAVSNLLYGIPIKTYYAMDLNGIGVLNSSVGGVSVTSPDTFNYFGEKYYKGETTLLNTSKRALGFVRYRDVTNLNSNTLRMKRQIIYLKAFSKTAIAKTKKNLTFPVTLYKTAKDYCFDNLNVSKITFLTTSILSSSGGSNMNFKNIEGETVSANSRAEFTPDDTSLFEIVLNTYYTEKAVN